jgi:glycerophosphoryl diester phosphodiesterase
LRVIDADTVLIHAAIHFGTISMSPTPKIIAHRGASGYAPELTLRAYQLAIQMGCDGIEMDVHPLRDGTIVAIHDVDVARTTNGNGRVSKFTLEELKALDAGTWFNNAYPEKARPEYAGLRVPTLQEIFDFTRGKALEFFIEIKDPELYPPDLESSLLSLVSRNQLEDRSRFLSFSAKSILKIKNLNPSMKTVLLISNSGKDLVEAALRLSADELGIRHSLITPTLVDAAHKAGLSVSAWTVDHQKDMTRMIDLGIDSIITNYPDRLKRLLTQ